MDNPSLSNIPHSKADPGADGEAYIRMFQLQAHSQAHHDCVYANTFPKDFGQPNLSRSVFTSPAKVCTKKCNVVHQEQHSVQLKAEPHGFKDSSTYAQTPAAHSMAYYGQGYQQQHLWSLQQCARPMQIDIGKSEKVQGHSKYKCHGYIASTTWTTVAQTSHWTGLRS